MNVDDRTFFVKYLEEKFTNLHKRIDALAEVKSIVDELPCERRSWYGLAIIGLYSAFGAIIIGGIVLGVWIKQVMAGG